MNDYTTTSGLKVVLKNLKLNEEDESISFPEFIIQGTLGNIDFEAKVSLELDGRDVEREVEPKELYNNLFAEDHSSPHMDDTDKILQAIYESEAYSQAQHNYDNHDWSKKN